MLSQRYLKLLRDKYIGCYDWQFEEDEGAFRAKKAPKNTSAMLVGLVLSEEKASFAGVKHVYNREELKTLLSRRF